MSKLLEKPVQDIDAVAEARHQLVREQLQFLEEKKQMTTTLLELCMHMHDSMDMLTQRIAQWTNELDARTELLTKQLEDDNQ